MKPIDRLNQWIRDDHEWIHNRLSATYGEQVVRSEIMKFRVWVEANPRKGNKKDWRRSFTNWLNKCDQILIKAVYNRAAVEKASENAKRRYPSTSEMERLDEGHEQD